MIGFRMPTRILVEPGAVTRLPEVARSCAMQSCLLVVDPGLRENTEWLDIAQRALESTGIRTHVFDQLEPNPRTSTVSQAADVLRQAELDGVISLGGGSAIDAGKAAAMLAENELRIEQYEGKNRYAAPPRPFVAIPTTCGTGSEVTWVSVLSHEPTNSKMSIKGDTMFPNQALVDADLLQTLPPHLVAWTGMDAMTHAIEAITGAAANEVSDSLALSAASLLFRYLERAAGDIEGDSLARECVMRASTLAGMAFGNADVAGVHCLSESIGGLYDTPHGVTNAILLMPVLRFHRPFIVDRLALLDDACCPQEPETPAEAKAAHFLDELESLCRRLEIPSFSTLGVRPEDHGRLAEWAVRNGSNRSNPQPMPPSAYQRILDGLAGVA
ncbi:MAG: iron-containing alcohol dehydrogenase [Thermoanaerobaculia bacterium]|nr:iron-containing alcohol dehydrogenase [Thermoanaerobaculia bacterium]